MRRSITDWKVIADRYYEKAVTLSILIFLFAFLVSPAVKVGVPLYPIEVLDHVVLARFVLVPVNVTALPFESYI